MTGSARRLRRHPNVRTFMDYHARYSNSDKNWLSLMALDWKQPHRWRTFFNVQPSATFLYEIYGAPQEELDLLPLGADLELSREVSAGGARQLLREQHKVPDDALVILTGGELAQAKWLKILIDASVQADDGITWLMVAGDGAPQDRAAYRLRERPALLPPTRFTGRREARHVDKVMDMADIAIVSGSRSIQWRHAIGMGMVNGEPMVRPGRRQLVSALRRHTNIQLGTRTALYEQGLAKVIKPPRTNGALRWRMADDETRTAANLLDRIQSVLRTPRINAPEQTRPLMAVLAVQGSDR